MSFSALPYDVSRKIIENIVDVSESSASLLPCLLMSKGVHDFVKYTPQLWTTLRADFKNIAYPDGPSPFHESWPDLYRAVRYSEDLPINFTIDLTSTDEEQLLRVTDDHLMSACQLLEQLASRCKELVVRCSDWAHITFIMANLVDIFLLHKEGYTILHRLEIRYLPNGGIGCHPVGPQSEIPENLFSTLDTDEFSLSPDQYSQMLFPKLKELALEGVPVCYERFFINKLTHLEISCPSDGPDYRPTYRQFKSYLDLNTSTLTSLDLRDWALPDADLNGLGELVLPELTDLSFTICSYYDFTSLTKSLRVPKLKKLIIRDQVHEMDEIANTFDLDTPSGDAEALAYRRTCLRGYELMQRNWPLDQVTHLTLCDAVFPVMDANHIDYLEASHRRNVSWPDGLPFASCFFHGFTSLTQLTLKDPDVTTKTAIVFPPVWYDPITSRRDFLQVIPPTAVVVGLD